jgi:hypothetical protein
MKRSLLKASTAWVTAAALLNPIGLSLAAWATINTEPPLTLATQTGTAGAAQGAIRARTAH